MLTVGNCSITAKQAGNDDYYAALQITKIIIIKDANTDTDTDGDGYPDLKDAFPNDKNEWLDTDNDGQGNNADLDDDNDGMPDTWETLYGLNPLNANDAILDKDGDGLNNRDEYKYNTNPKNKDTDGDGKSDGDEVKAGTNPIIDEGDINKTAIPVIIQLLLED